jgi:hypothetical protein
MTFSRPVSLAETFLHPFAPEDDRGAHVNIVHWLLQNEMLVMLQTYLYAHAPFESSLLLFF